MTYKEFKKEAGILGTAGKWVYDRLTSKPAQPTTNQASKPNGINATPNTSSGAIKQTQGTPAANQPVAQNNVPTGVASPNPSVNKSPNTAPQNTNTVPATPKDTVIPSDLLNNDAINRIKDPVAMRQYLEIMLPASAGLQQLVSGGKFTMDAVLENDTAVDGFSKALETANPMALQVLQQMQKEMAAKGGKAGTKPDTGGSTTSSIKDQNMQKLTNSAAKGVWNSIKENPLENFPKAIAMFLSHIGAGKGITEFVSNPLTFYGSLLALLLGGGLLMAGGGDDDDEPVRRSGNGYYPNQQPAGYNRIPYT